MNRGWVPGQYRDATKRLLGQIEGTQEITGVIRLSEKRPTFVPKNKPKQNIWYYRYVYLFVYLRKKIMALRKIRQYWIIEISN